MRTDGLAALKKSLRALARKAPGHHGAGADGRWREACEMYRVGEVLERSSRDGTEELTVRLEGWQAERLEREGVEVRRMGDRQRSRATG
jgi:hypothetical protein